MGEDQRESVRASERESEMKLSHDLPISRLPGLRANARSPVTGRASPVTGHRSRVTSHAFVVALALGAAISLAGCDYLPFGYTPIKEILGAPAHFEGKQVKLKGKVRDPVKLPILGKAFVLHDEGGEITVMTEGTLPAANSEVALKGTVKSAAIIGGQSLGLRVEEIHRLR